MKESSPSACEKQQGSRSQAFCLQTYELLRPNVRTSSQRRANLLPSRKGGPRITVGRKDGRTAVFAASSEPTRGKKDLISRTNFERSSGMPGPGSLKCLTQALHAPASGKEYDRETHNNSGTDTKIEICDTVPFPGNSCGSFPSSKVATTDAATAVCVQKRGGLVRNDVEQSHKDPVRADVGSRSEWGRLLVGTNTESNWHRSLNPQSGTK